MRINDDTNTPYAVEADTFLLLQRKGNFTIEKNENENKSEIFRLKHEVPVLVHVFNLIWFFQSFYFALDLWSGHWLICFFYIFISNERKKGRKIRNIKDITWLTPGEIIRNICIY